MRLRLHHSVAFLLALLLAVLPLQRALAASSFPPAARALSSQQAHASMQATEKCRKCQQHDCCLQGQCDAQGCAFCVVTALFATPFSFDLSNDTPRAGFAQPLPERHNASLYRPPRA